MPQDIDDQTNTLINKTCRIHREELHHKTWSRCIQGGQIPRHPCQISHMSHNSTKKQHYLTWHPHNHPPRCKLPSRPRSHIAHKSTKPKTPPHQSPLPVANHNYQNTPNHTHLLPCGFLGPPMGLWPTRISTSLLVSPGLRASQSGLGGATRGPDMVWWASQPEYTSNHCT